jgi:arylsulfatase A-like enzyme
VLVASLVQPHDICYWSIRARQLVPEQMTFPEIAARLPELPPNLDARPKAPAALAARAFDAFSDEQWRYHLYIYARQIEMLDADVGRILDALEDSGLARDTIVIFTSDHGDGRARHKHVQKWYPYDEAVKVPLVFSCPGRIEENRRDATHLVSSVDLLATMCDFSGIAPPKASVGMSLRPLIEGRPVAWREYLGIETQYVGRVIRTDRFKYVCYKGDPVEQLFDMKDDPWETRNLYEEARYADVLRDHRRMLEEWNARLTPVPSTVPRRTPKTAAQSPSPAEQKGSR